ncbi:SusC/RagA family TonB-linked outer membrane protein [Pedobacter sp.]|uniref:SusC/RagA family TonB-linked outer membrane protein n=1 Tax=Pedobacter sp. TaxID=1411316 RepID=UPI003C426C6B
MKKLLLFLVLLLPALGLFAQDRQVTGTVKDGLSKKPLSDVNVVVKGSNLNTKTDKNGKFTLSVKGQNSIDLIISLVGYTTKTVTTNGTIPVSVSLDEDLQNLDDVVVIGYGTVRKRDLTGAVTSVKSDEIKEVPAQNPLQSIQGKVAGADITRGSGSSSSGVTITLRGNRSIGAGNSPLFIVDGVQTASIDDINPNSIESMEFLKDASSTAIYGWQGANGVVIISTKKGTAGKTKVSLNSYYGISNVSRYPSVLDGPGYVALKREANRTIGKWATVADDSKIFNTQELNAIANNDWIDYQKLLFHTGHQQNYNAGVTAGTDKTKMFFNVDYYNEKGILKFDETKRYSIRANVDQSFNSWIKAGVQTQITNRDESYRRDPLNLANKIIPLGTVYDSNGSFILFPVGGNTISPLADEQPDVFSNSAKVTNVIANAYLDLKPIEGLTFRSNFGATIGNTREGSYEGQNSISRATSTGSLAYYNASNSRFINWDNVATYQKQIKDHSFTLTALTSYVESLRDNVGASGQNQLLGSQLFYDLGSATSNMTVSSGYEKWDVISFAGRLNYSYKSKYLATLTARADGASRLSKGNKWASFPSAAVAWRLIDESFMKNLKFLSDFKIRLSYGVAGNSGIQPYGTQSVLQRVPMSFGEKNFQGFTFSDLIGNPDTGWELSKTKNLGFDLGFFGSRLSATVDIYDTNTSDLLLERNLPLTTGVKRVVQNIGSTRNKGIEVALNSVNIKTETFSWRSSLTFARNKEKIVSLVTQGVDDIGSGWFIGQPTRVFYDYEKLGIWQANEVTEAAKFNQVPGDIKVKDQNGDGKIDNINDRVVLGPNNIPKWFGGLDNKISFKKFDFNLYFFARWGQMINPAFLSRYDRQANLSNSGAIINYWTPENGSNDYPRPNANISGASTLYFSTIGYVDGSYIRLRNVSLGYTFSDFKKAFFKDLRIYVAGTNLLTWTKNSKLKEYDPERGGGESAPMLKNVTFGLNIGL